MIVEMLQSEWGKEKVNNAYHVTLYRIEDGNSVWYRINIENTRDGRYARRVFLGPGARKMAQKEFDGIVYGDKTPMQYAWM